MSISRLKTLRKLTHCTVTALVASLLATVAPLPANAVCGISTGTGTSGDPYQISTETEFRAIGSNDCHGSSSTKYYKFTNNIKLTSAWTPINLSSRGVHLDGDNFQLSGLSISSSLSDAAIFSQTTASGSVKNLSIIADDIVTTYTGSNASASLVIGGVGPSAFWVIDNVHAIVANITSPKKAAGFAGSLGAYPSEIKNSSLKVTGSIVGTTEVAGAVNYIYGKVENVQVTANLDASGSTATSAAVGGLVTQVFNTSSGQTSVLDSHFAGQITGNGLGDSRVGGLVGYDYTGATSTTLSIARSSSNAQLSGGFYMGGLLGYTDASGPSISIQDSTFKGTIDAGTASLNPKMGGMVGYFGNSNRNAQSISLMRNLISVKFLGSGSAEARASFTENSSGTAIDANHLQDNVYDSSALNASTYTGPMLARSAALGDADIVARTQMDLQNSANYPSSFNIQTPATVPDLGTSPRTKVWAMCNRVDLVNASVSTLETYAYLLTEASRCANLGSFSYSVYPSQTVSAGSAMTPVYPNSTSVTEAAAMRGIWYTVSPALPAGLGIHPRTGKLSGKPATVDGTLYTLTATNGASSQSTTFNLFLDTTAPTISSTTPADGSTFASSSGNLTVSFSEPVTAVASKSIRLVSSNGTTSIPVTSSEITGSGTNTIVINPTSDLGLGADYHVEIDSGAFSDSSGNLFAGISDSTTWNFTTAKVPTAGLTVALDASNLSSYSGTGSVWYDLAGSADNATFYKDGSTVGGVFTPVVNTTPTLNTTAGIKGFTFATSAKNHAQFSTQNLINNASSTRIIWFKPTNFSSVNNLMSSRNTEAFAFWGGGGTSACNSGIGDNLAAGNNGLWTTVVSSECMELAWQMAAVTFDSTNGWKLYRNGALVGSSANTTQVSAGNLNYITQLGKYSYTDNHYFDGLMSQVYIYDHALTQADLETIFDSTAGYFGLASLPLVSFDSQGGSSAAASLRARSDGTVVLPTATKTDSTFLGWYSAASGGTLIGAAGATYTPSSNVTLYARWQTTYTVTYNANGGSVSPTSASYQVGVSNALALPTPTRASYVFGGWYTAASGGTLVGAAGASYTPTASSTLYARWGQLPTVTLSYSSQTYPTLSATATLNKGGSTGAATYSIANYTGSSAASGCTVNASTGAVTATSAGECRIRVTIAADSTYLETSQESTVTFGKAATQIAWGTGANAVTIKSPDGSTRTITLQQHSTIVGAYSLELKLGEIVKLPFNSPNSERVGYTSYVYCPSVTGWDQSEMFPFDGSGNSFYYLKASSIGPCAKSGSQAAANYLTLNSSNFTNNLSAPIWINVVRGDQNPISVLGDTNANFGDTVILDAEGGSGLGARTFSVTGSGCSITNIPLVYNGISYAALGTAELTKSGAGSCDVTVTKAADTRYNEITSSTFTVTFAKGSQELEFTSNVPSEPIVGGIYIPVVSSSSALTPTISVSGACSYDGNTSEVTFTSANGCTITASQSGNTDYLAATSITQVISVGERNQSISFAALTDKEFGDPAFLVSATSTEVDLTVDITSATSSVCTITSSGVVTLLTAGTCTLNADQAGLSGVVAAASRVTRSFTVYPAGSSAPFITSVSRGLGSLTATLVPPSYTGGGTITKYFVGAYDLQGNLAGFNNSCSVASPQKCTVSGLDEGVAYTLKARAYHGAGFGSFSPDSIAMSPVANPDAVRELSAVAGDTTLTISWLAPLYLGGATFQRYDVYVKLASASSYPGTPSHQVTCSSAACDGTYTFTGMTNGASYDVKMVTITDVDGTEITSNTALVSQTPYTTPNAVRGLNAFQVGSFIILSWQYPDFDGGRSISSYSISVNSGALSCQTANRSCAIPVGNLTTFNFSIVATNIAGDGLAATTAFNIPGSNNQGNGNSASGYSGPTITSASTRQPAAGQAVWLRGERLEMITSLKLDGKEVPFVRMLSGELQITFPDGLAAGVYDLQVLSSSGLLTVQDLFEITAAGPSIEALTGVQIKTVNGLLKVYVFDLVGAGKVQIFFNAKEVAWVNARSITDPKLRRLSDDLGYLVRTIRKGAKVEVRVNGKKMPTNLD